MKPGSLGKVRTGQLLTTFGPGSIVDLPDGGSYLVMGLDRWRPGERIDEPNLEHILGVSRLSAPSSDKTERDIPVTSFPLYHHCPTPTCGRLLEAGHCRHCNVTAPPARFISLCKGGHLGDFPWSWWVHEGAANHTCDDLALEDRSGSNSLADLWVECRSTHERRSLRGALEPRSFKDYPCLGWRPWLGDTDPNPCDRPVTGALRGASNVYFANTLSALSLPRHGSPLHVLLRDHWVTLEKLDDEQRTLVLPALLAGTKYTAEQGLKAFHERLKVAADAASLRAEEYEALAGDHEGAWLGPPAPYFEASNAAVPPAGADLFDMIVNVRRLREVTALRGFTRLEGPDPEEPDAVTPAPISRARPQWLPAREVFGEGIFFRLSERVIQKADGAPQLTATVARVGAAYDAWRAERKLPPEPKAVTAKRLLVHSLAHLLIRELSLACGYGVSALRERIYTGPDQHGLLVYTASADADGSLGGLVRMGERTRLGPVIASALESAHWCSQDPLCGERPPDPGSHLSGAACHVCLLLPETSCELNNRFLDRGSVMTVAAT